MKLTYLRTNHLPTPLGYDYGVPVLSWQVEDSLSPAQAWARIEVSTDANFRECIYDSGEDPAADSIAYALPIELRARTRYYWRVTVQGQAGDRADAESWFETAKQDEPWLGRWITPDWEDDAIHPLLRREFTLPQEAVSARLYICGMGSYLAEINGQRVGCEYLAPGFSAFDCWCPYQSYDVTDLLRPGRNAIGAMLGNAWAKGHFGRDSGIYSRRFALLAELRATLADGSEWVLGSDDDWQAIASPIRWSEIYDGECYDATAETEGWSSPGCCADWQGTRLWSPPVGPLTARLSLPVVVRETFRPAAIFRTPGGDTIIDAGQNTAGWLRLKLDLPAGTELILSHGEILQDGEFYRGNLGSAKQEYRFLSRGVPAEVEPHFTFYGFRYVKVEGWDPDPEAVTICSVRSDLEETGRIETSNPAVNQLFSNVLWGQRDNFLDTPTDCPQRSERMGWTGDAQVFCGTACYNMDGAAFYSKYMRDVYAEQYNPNTSTGTGCVPNIVPNLIERTPGRDSGSCAWADCATVIPWTLYEYYGDRSLLRRHFPAMRAWVDWVASQGVDVRTGGGWLKNMHFGDWLALDNTRNPDSYAGGTENAFLAAAYYRYSTALTAKAARVLGEDALAEHYQTISDQVREELVREYYSPNGRGTMRNQTYFLVSLFMDIAPEEMRPRLMEQFAAVLEEDNYHLKTGFIGTPILCRVLSDYGRSDLAYRLLLNDDYPSWLYEVKMGATTVWERWNSVLPDGHINPINMNSLNHYAYGSIAEWMYRNMCGLRPAAPGFRRVVIRPEPDRHFSYARADYRSAVGWYHSGWSIQADGTLVFEVTVPFGAQAELYLPHCEASEIPGARQEGSSAVLQLPAGRYRYQYMPTRSYQMQPMSLECSVRTIQSTPAARALLDEMQIFIPPMFLDMGDPTLSELRSSPMAAMMFRSVDWDELDRRLHEILI